MILSQEDTHYCGRLWRNYILANLYQAWTVSKMKFNTQSSHSKALKNFPCFQMQSIEKIGKNQKTF